MADSVTSCSLKQEYRATSELRTRSDQQSPTNSNQKPAVTARQSPIITTANGDSRRPTLIAPTFRKAPLLPRPPSQTGGLPRLLVQPDQDPPGALELLQEKLLQLAVHLDQVGGGRLGDHQLKLVPRQLAVYEDHGWAEKAREERRGVNVNDMDSDVWRLSISATKDVYIRDMYMKGKCSIDY